MVSGLLVYFHVFSENVSSLIMGYFWVSIILGIIVGTYAIVFMPSEATAYTPTIYHSVNLWAMLGMYILALGPLGIVPFLVHRKRYLQEPKTRADLDS